jgi:hypothetical protein
MAVCAYSAGVDMKQHFCPVEKSIIAYKNECNWCGEKEQKPVAWEQFHEHMASPFYQKPPQRTWVGLTNEEIALIVTDCSLVTPSDFYFAKAIEAKLKDKNCAG